MREEKEKEKEKEKEEEEEEEEARSSTVLVHRQGEAPLGKTRWRLHQATTAT